MTEWLNSGPLEWLASPERILSLVRAVVLLIVGIVFARVLSAIAARSVTGRLDAQGRMLVKRFVFYSISALVVASAFHQLGFKLQVLVGAAGVLTVALGFASQTSASNLISGLFLIVERPFVVGDVVRIDDVTGEVLSIDLLSTKIRTFDNLFVRVPNESIIKTRITNLAYFPLRRADLAIGVSYKEDLDRVRTVLLDVADQNPLCLDEPQPVFIFTGYGDSSLNMQFSVWTKRENFLDMRNAIYFEIKAAFDREGIEILFPQRSLNAGSTTEPFPVRMVDTPGSDEDSITRT
jgi:small-conductance mechanosensitive channel